MILNFLIGFLFLIGVLLFAWWCISGNRIREYKDDRGNTLPNSLSEKSIIEINGVPNGVFINSRDISNPVLLLVSSGPGTDDYFLTERFSDMHLDDLFTLVYWDYRGMCLVYDSDMDPAAITADILVDDTRAMTEYLKERFHQEKIYLMGFSGGTNNAVRAAQAYPELYYAYIAMAQVVTDSSENDKLMYDFMKSVFEERGDTAKLKKLESLIHYKNKQAIFDAIFEEMVRRYDSFTDTISVHTKNAANDLDTFKSISADELVKKVKDLVVYSLHDEYVCCFRKMMTIEQFRSPEFSELYSKRYVDMTYEYHKRLFIRMIDAGVIKAEDPGLLAMMYTAPIYVYIGQCDRHPEMERQCLQAVEGHVRLFFKTFTLTDEEGSD